MNIKIILPVLFCIKIVFGGVCEYQLEFENKWPHCANLGACFTNTKIDQAITKCDSLKDCVGFSFTANANENTLGNGCYKHNNNGECSKNGFGTGSHGFYKKENKYKKVMDKRWPHCLNLNINGKSCFNNMERWQVERNCDSNPKCVGFSFTTDSNLGHGCYKQNPNDVCNKNGIGSGNHDYYEKKSTCVDYSDCYYPIYEKKWPHCTNIRCFNGITKEDAQDICDIYPNCVGFSFSAGLDDWTKGNGCLKQNPNNICTRAGFGSGSHDYYQRQRYSKIFSGKWPHCSNIGSCFNGITVQQASAKCDAASGCIGFSFTANADENTKGHGCLKSKNNCNGGGFGVSSHEFYGKCVLTNNNIIYKANSINNIDYNYQKNNINLFNFVKNNNIYVYTAYFIVLPILTILLILLTIYKSCLNNNKSLKYKYISTSESDTSSDDA